MMNLVGLRIRGAAFSCALVFACGDADAQGAARVSDAQVNAAIHQLESLAQAEIRSKTVPGLAIAIAFHDKVVYAKGFGVRDTTTNRPVDADTVFQLASLSKPLGATVVAELVGEGKITWDSKISDLDPGFSMSEPWITREITIRDFYAHRSGLPEHSGDLLEDMGYSRGEILHRLRFQHPNSSFRAGYAYTNFGMTEAGVAAAKAYGMSWEDASAQKLYKPLGMSATSSRFADFMARGNKALGHVRIDGKWVQKFKRDPDAQSPAGGASSSANDMAKWMRLQLAGGKFNGRQLVNTATLEETHHPQILTGFNQLTGAPTFYGLGWNVSYDDQGRLRLNHSGGFALGAGTHINLVPSEQLGIVVLTNAAPIGLAEGLGFTFMDTALYGRPTRDWLTLFRKVFATPAALGVVAGFDYSKPPASPSPALSNSAYAGMYTNDFFGDIQIVEKNGGLVLLEGPHRVAFPLRHYDRDTFTYETQGENATGRSGVTFTVGANGTASTLLIEALNVRGEGTFRRKSAAGK